MVYEGHLPGESELSAIYEYLIPFVGRWYVLGYSGVKDSGENPGRERGNKVTLIELRQVPIGACRNSINVN